MKILTTALYSFIIEVLWILNTVRYNWSLSYTHRNTHHHCLSSLFKPSHFIQTLDLNYNQLNWIILSPVLVWAIWSDSDSGYYEGWGWERCWYWLSVLTRLLSGGDAGRGMLTFPHWALTGQPPPTWPSTGLLLGWAGNVTGSPPGEAGDVSRDHNSHKYWNILTSPLPSSCLTPNINWNSVSAPSLS